VYYEQRRYAIALKYAGNERASSSLHSSSALICAVLVVDRSTDSMSSAPRMSRARGLTGRCSRRAALGRKPNRRADPARLAAERQDVRPLVRRVTNPVDPKWSSLRERGALANLTTLAWRPSRRRIGPIGVRCHR